MSCKHTTRPDVTVCGSCLAEQAGIQPTVVKVLGPEDRWSTDRQYRLKRRGRGGRMR